MKTIQLTKYTTFFYFIFNNTKSLFDFIYLKVALCPLWLKFRVHSCKFVAKIPKKNKAKSQANINLLLTDNYQDQQMSGKKTNPIFFPQNLILSVKNGGLSMMYQKTLKIPNKANLKMTQMNVTKELTTDYNRMDTWCRGKNKANSKPICFLKTE